MDNLQATLTNLGFNTKEIEIYTALLELGEASYADVAKATGINRTSLYPMVSKLQERGIVQYHLDNKKLSPVAPASLFSKLQKEVLKFHKLVPQLEDLSKRHRSISRIKFYVGLEGIKRAYNEPDEKLPPKKDRMMYVVSDSAMWNDFWSMHDDSQEEFLELLKRQGYRGRVFVSGEPTGWYSKETAQKYNYEVKALPPEYQVEFDLEVRPNYIIITDVKSETPYAIRINSTELASALMRFFDFTWNLYK